MCLEDRLDGAVRTCSNVSRDRGPRAVLEASGAVVVLFCLSWRLGPILAGEHKMRLSTQPAADASSLCQTPRHDARAKGHVRVMSRIQSAPVLRAGVVVGTACTASLYKQQTRAVERSNSEALGRMSSVASQAFSGIRTVR